MVLPFFPPLNLLLGSSWGSEKRRRTSRGEVLRLIQDPFSDAEFGKNLANLSNQFAASADRPLQFNKRSQRLIRTQDETFSVAAMRICNPDCSPFGINR